MAAHPSTSSILNVDTDESWTDGGDSISSCPRRDYMNQLRAIHRDMEIMKINVQIMLDQILKLVNTTPECSNCH